MGDVLTMLDDKSIKTLVGNLLDHKRFEGKLKTLAGAGTRWTRSLSRSRAAPRRSNSHGRGSHEYPTEWNALSSKIERILIESVLCRMTAVQSGYYSFPQ